MLTLQRNINDVFGAYTLVPCPPFHVTSIFDMGVASNCSWNQCLITPKSTALAVLIHNSDDNETNTLTIPNIQYAKENYHDKCPLKINKKFFDMPWISWFIRYITFDTPSLVSADESATWLWNHYFKNRSPKYIPCLYLVYWYEGHTIWYPADGGFSEDFHALHIQGYGPYNYSEICWYIYLFKGISITLKL